jgi:hypothetical protein
MSTSTFFSISLFIRQQHCPVIHAFLSIILSGNPTGKCETRALVHMKGLWHRVVHVWIYNRNRELLLQKRASIKETWPDKWDISSVWHCFRNLVRFGSLSLLHFHWYIGWSCFCRRLQLRECTSRVGGRTGCQTIARAIETPFYTSCWEFHTKVRSLSLSSLFSLLSSLFSLLSPFNDFLLRSEQLLLHHFWIVNLSMYMLCTCRISIPPP